MRQLLSVLLLALWVALPAGAAIDTYEFSTQVERERYRSLIEELRCPKCQNQNIADSDADISLDLRDETYRMMVEEGMSDEQIIDFLVERYGDFVRYKPPVDQRTLVLWYGPFTMFILALLVLAIIVMRRRKANALNRGQGLSAEEQQRIAQLLDTRQQQESADK